MIDMHRRPSRKEASCFSVRAGAVVILSTLLTAVSGVIAIDLQQAAGDVLSSEAPVSTHDQWTNTHVQSSQSATDTDLSTTATPWLLPATTRLPYEGFHNNLDSLLKIQRTQDSWISVFMFSAGVAWWTQNSIFSYIKYGRSTSYIIAAPDAKSLSACLELRLPCLNMSSMGVEVEKSATATTSMTAQGWKSPAYYALVWAKVDLVRRILMTGHHVHFSDVDVVYLRPIWPTYRRVFATSGPDAIFMQEQWQVGADPSHPYVNMFNTGVYAIRSNPRALNFMNQWYGSGTQPFGNQPFINNLAFSKHATFSFCQSAPECNLLRRRHLAALLLHPPQSSHASCPPAGSLARADACGDDLLFIHYICSPQGWGLKGPGSKAHMLDLHNLRLLDSSGMPLYAEGRPNATTDAGVPLNDDGMPLYDEDLDGSTGASGQPFHPFLPCDKTRAWLKGIPVARDQAGVPWPVDALDQ